LLDDGYLCRLGTGFTYTVLYPFCDKKFSVADPGCLSRIPDPDFYPSRIPDLGSRIPDPKTETKDRGEKKFFVKPYFVATNFTKLHIIFFLYAEENNLAQFSRNY
jgi:hypothetical protein